MRTSPRARPLNQHWTLYYLDDVDAVAAELAARVRDIEDQDYGCRD